MPDFDSVNLVDPFVATVEVVDWDVPPELPVPPFRPGKPRPDDCTVSVEPSTAVTTPETNGARPAIPGPPGGPPVPFAPVWAPAATVPDEWDPLVTFRATMAPMAMSAATAPETAQFFQVDAFCGGVSGPTGPGP